MALADNYAALMRFREEALRKYKTTTATAAKGPPARVVFPSVSTKDEFLYRKRLGRIYVGLKSAITEYVNAELKRRASPANVLEIGPGGGELATYLGKVHVGRISRYYALDRDRSVKGPFERLDSVDDVPNGIDLVVASEVIEHMPADDFFSGILRPLHAKLSPTAVAVISVPNPLSPGGIARDFSHVQNYPWYDLYAVMRLAFARVKIYRSISIGSPSKLLSLLPRIACCNVMDLDWCERLICVASEPTK
jgi:hypothetical protein